MPPAARLLRRPDEALGRTDVVGAGTADELHSIINLPREFYVTKTVISDLSIPPLQKIVVNATTPHSAFLRPL